MEIVTKNPRNRGRLIALQTVPSRRSAWHRTGQASPSRSVRHCGATATKQNTARGQYTAGASVSGPVRGYLDELGHPESMTETCPSLP
jgi:glucose-6-phosphate 1-dehydrogenase